MAIEGMIVGLGNPGAEYEHTRHNYGFMVVRALLDFCERKGSVTLLSSRKDPFFLWRICSDDKAFRFRDWLAAMPQTYMNRSGDAVQRIAAYYHVDMENVLVLHDELDLPLGRMKLKKGGGNAGHNGLKSIQQMTGTAEFYRLRLGVGRPRGGNGASYVLSRFAESERAPLAETVAAAVRGVLLFMTQEPRTAIQFCNAFALPEQEAPAEADQAPTTARPPAPQ